LGKNSQLPKVQNLRVDLLGETAGGQLVHFELQRKNDSSLPFRMLEYSVVITRLHGRVPQQIAVYIGPEPLRMLDVYEWPNTQADRPDSWEFTPQGRALVPGPKSPNRSSGVLVSRPVRRLKRAPSFVGSA